MAEENPACDSFKAAAIQCIAMDTTGQCATCLDLETFPTDFPADLKRLFASTQAFAIPGTDQFCNIANDRICAEAEANYSCCCQQPIDDWQNCLVENVYSADLSLPRPCSSSCMNSGGGGGSSMGIIIGAVAAVVVIGGGLAFWCLRRRRAARAAAAGGTGSNKDDKKKSDSKTDSKTDSNKDNRTIEDMEEGVFSDSSEDNKSQDTPAKDRGIVPSTIMSRPLNDDNSVDDSVLEERRPKPSKRVSTRARDKKKAIEEWNKMKKQGSNRSLESFVSGESSAVGGNDSDEESLPDRRPSRRSSRDMPRSSSFSKLAPVDSKKKLPRKISSRDLSNLLKENEENAKKLEEVEQEVEAMDDKLYKADKDREKLRREREYMERRLAELEAQNKSLRKELGKDGDDRSDHRRSSKSRSKSGERRSSRERSSERKSSRERSSERRRSRSRDGLSSKDKPASFRESLSKVDDMSTSWDHESVKKYSK